MSNPTLERMLMEDSIQDSEPFDTPFVDRQLISVGDSNGGSYSQGQITFDLNSLSTSEAFMSLKTANILVPFEMKIVADGGNFLTSTTAPIENAYAMTLKNCIYNLIDSISVNINGSEVVSQVANSNMFNTYKILTQWSPADQETQGPTYNFAKDSADSLEFDTILGKGETNTKLVATDGSKVPGVIGSANMGRLRRARWQCVSADAMVTAFQTDLNRAKNLWMSTCETSAAEIKYSMFLVVPLKGLHDFFDKCPLLRKSIVKVVLNTNAPSSYKATLNPATGALTAISSNTPRGTCPFQITPGAVAVGQGFAWGTCTGFTASCKIGNSQTNQCLFRCNRYILSPEQEVKYLADSVKTIRYDDIYSGIIKNVATSQNNVQIGSALSRIRRLVIFPQLAAGNPGNRDLTPLASPWSSAPATCAPYWWASNLNVAVSGQNLFSQPMNYRFEQWMSEMDSSGSINGGYTDGIRSGLISKYDFDSLYGCIDVNLSRHPALADESPQIISLTLKPEHSMPADLYHFTVYNREISIDVGTGALMA